MRLFGGNYHTRLLCGVAYASMMAAAAPAYAQGQDVDFNIPSQSLSAALDTFAAQSRQPILVTPEMTAGKVSRGVEGAAATADALGRLLEGTGLTWRLAGKTFLIVQQGEGGSGPQGAGADVDALIVTAQKREENIQDVPIAISAFSQEDLTRSQVAGGPDLITQVPNMTFTKTNFTSYSIQLRGIGTQAISATVDPAVAVAFNNTPFIRNRFFEQEFYDLQRIEVLRGPQGTLYGRNATAGVVNLISAKPKFVYEAKVSADVANYQSTRLEGMVNVPLVEDVVALRVAGAWTKRQGYAVNEVEGNRIDGRDLWSSRVSLRFAPNDVIDANLIWEHFEEDDDRIRSGKQLCKTDVVTEAAGIAVTDFYQPLRNGGQDSEFDNVQSAFSQGCLPASLYSPDSFQKTNSLALPYYVPLGAIHLPIARTPEGRPADPYASRTQSTDLRVIEAAVDPGYRAKTDIVELQLSVDLSESLSLSSETSWASDFIFSTQDYNRFAGAPNAWRTDGIGPQIYVARGLLSPEGVFCDPQIGCSDRLVAMDLSTARSRQFSQELRLASDFDGPFNFSFGGNVLRYDTEDKYYVFINSISMLSAYLINGLSAPPFIPYEPGVTDNRTCLPLGMIEPDYSRAQPIAACTYLDPNPITSLNDLGHNYFLSKNPYKLISYAAFGEAYFNLAENLKITAGLRWTVDKKEAPEIPSWIFAASTVGYPVIDVVRQEWQEPTGRLAIDWKPRLGFTDETMVYASYSHGYKAGGMNPPSYGKTIYGTSLTGFGGTGSAQDLSAALGRASVTHPKTFDPEFIDAFEIGAKNTLLDGRLTLNLAGFYYDYKGYQLSQIVDRSAVTQNFDADIWGIELESDWRPMENLRLGLKLGYENTKVGDGMQAIDVMDRTAGHEEWLVTRPFPSLPTNCVLPAWLFLGSDERYPGNPDLVDVGGKGGGNPGGCEYAYLLDKDPVTQAAYQLNGAHQARDDVNYAAWSTDRADYPCLPAEITTIGVMNYPGVDPQCLIAASNNGEGFFKDLSGNELPNAPNLTATITADYTLPLPNDWLMTLHTDLYYQSESWTRIFNTEGYDKLKAYSNINLAAIFTNEDAGWRVMAYVKNVLDRDSITGAFLNSDDSGLTTNVFLTEPRLYGIRVTKDFDGGPWWTGANPSSAGPFPLTIELGGQVQRHDAPYQDIVPAFVPNLAEAIDPTVGLQNRDLDWGDGRSLRVSYRPAGSSWSMSGGVRYGRTNNETARGHRSRENVQTICGATDPFYAYIACDPASPYYDLPETAGFRTVRNIEWADASARSAEEHSIVDFDVGRDVGIGGLDSTVKGGIRHADLQSRTSIFGQALAGWDIPVGWIYYDSTFQRYEANIAVDREFKGTGPMLSWQAAVPVLGTGETGRLKVDWSAGAGILFGKQKTAISGREQAAEYVGRYKFQERFDQVGAPTLTALPDARSQSVSVPVVDLSLGLSYDVGRIRVGAGYRWERYFDVLDVGYHEQEDGDRTIDGPYFKLAVGFGG